jgi:hypothetical protein
MPGRSWGAIKLKFEELRRLGYYTGRGVPPHRRRHGWTALALIFFAWPAPAQPLRYTPDPQRSADVVREYRAANPCPATGLTTGACPGWAVDHRWPLCAGGKDAVDNLGWMADADKLKKDRFEWAVCRHLRALRDVVGAVR